MDNIIQSWAVHGGSINKYLLNNPLFDNNFTPEEIKSYKEIIDELDRIFQNSITHQDYYLFRGIGISERNSIFLSAKSENDQHLYKRIPYLPCSTSLRNALKFAGNDIEETGKTVLCFFYPNGLPGIELGNVYVHSIQDNLNEEEILIPRNCWIQQIGFLTNEFDNGKKISFLLCQVIHPNAGKIKDLILEDNEKRLILEQLTAKVQSVYSNYIEKEFDLNEWKEAPLS